MVGNSVVLEDVAEVPEPGNDVGGDGAHGWLLSSSALGRGGPE